MSSSPIPLSDFALTYLFQLAEPLAVVDRDPFLRAVAARLQAEPHLDDGVVVRAAKAAQAKFFRPPTLVETTKYDRRSRRGGNGKDAA